MLVVPVLDILAIFCSMLVVWLCIVVVILISYIAVNFLFSVRFCFGFCFFLSLLFVALSKYHNSTSMDVRACVCDEKYSIKTVIHRNESSNSSLNNVCCWDKYIRGLKSARLLKCN